MSCITARAQEDEERAAAEPAENDTEKVREHERKKPGRKPLPEHLPRVKIEVLPPEVQLKGLDAFKRIGEEVREVLERRPASMVVVQIVRPKFVESSAPMCVSTMCDIAPGVARWLPKLRHDAA